MMFYYQELQDSSCDNDGINVSHRKIAYILYYIIYPISALRLV